MGERSNVANDVSDVASEFTELFILLGMGWVVQVDGGEGEASEAPLSRAQVATASLGLQALRRQVHRWRRVEEVSRRTGGPLLRLVDAEIPAVQLVAVEPGDGRGRGRTVGVLDERESPGPPGRPVGGQEDLDDFSRLREQTLELVARRREGQVPDEQFGADGILLPACDGIGASVRGRRAPACTLMPSGSRAPESRAPGARAPGLRVPGSRVRRAARSAPRERGRRGCRSELRAV